MYVRGVVEDGENWWRKGGPGGRMGNEKCGGSEGGKGKVGGIRRRQHGRIGGVGRQS